MGLALLFSGQGAQHAGMLRWVDDALEAKPALDAMAAHLGPDWRPRLADPAWATTNAVAQVLLTGLAVAAWRVLAARLPPRVVVATAGYSVGEVPALAAAGVLDDAGAVALAATRAALMDAAADPPGGLLAVGGVADAAIASACLRHGASVAIDLAPGKAVIGGSLHALQLAGADLAAQGADIAMLPVRLASHTPAMAPARDAFAAHVDGLPWRRAGVVLVTNLDGGEAREPQALRRAIAGQLAATVQWRRSLETLAERRPGCVLEVGPGSALSRAWRQRWPDVPARSVDEFRDAEGVIDWVSRQRP